MSDWVPTTCMRCAVGCGHPHRGADLGTGIDVVRGDAAQPVNQGLACQRGIEESQDPEGPWLTRPQVRRDGELVPTTWDVALSEAVAGLRRAQEAGRSRSSAAASRPTRPPTRWASSPAAGSARGITTQTPHCAWPAP